MLKVSMLTLLSLAIVFIGGCDSPEPVLRDELRDVEEALYSARFHLDEARNFYEDLERELRAVESTEWEIENLGHIQEYVTLMGWRAEDMDNMLKQAIDDVGEAQSDLEDIIWRYTTSNE